jgi:hypothetical protein
MTFFLSVGVVCLIRAFVPSREVVRGLFFIIVDGELRYEWSKGDVVQRRIRAAGAKGGP